MSIPGMLSRSAVQLSILLFNCHHFTIRSWIANSDGGLARSTPMRVPSVLSPMKTKRHGCPPAICLKSFLVNGAKPLLSPNFGGTPIGRNTPLETPPILFLRSEFGASSNTESNAASIRLAVSSLSKGPAISIVYRGDFSRAAVRFVPAIAGMDQRPRRFPTPTDIYRVPLRVLDRDIRSDSCFLPP